MPFAVITDAASNLPPELAKKQNITVIPQNVYIDEVEYIQDENFDLVNFYEQMKAGVPVRTSQIPPQRFEEYFKPSLEEGLDILCITLSSGVSGSYQSACIAADLLMDEYPGREIYVIDSKGASCGIALQVLEAARLRDLGLEAKKAAETCEKRVRNMYQLFAVDDLKYLKKTGRISGAVATVGTMLNIKPLLKGNEEGKIVSVGKVRGHDQMIKTMVDRFMALADEPMKQLVGICHANCPALAAKLHDALLMSKKAPREILTVILEPVGGAHVGPGMLGLFFWGNDQVRFQ